MKKLMSLLMAIMFLWLAMPLNVIAEAVNPLPTSQELAAAIALTGLSDDAPGYHPGMEFSSTMNAQQLLGWIDDFIDNRLVYVMDSFQNYDAALVDFKRDYPAKYDEMNSAPGIGIDLFYSDYHWAMALRDEVHYYRDKLSAAASRVFTMAQALQSAELTEKEQAVYAYQIRDDWRNMEEIIMNLVEDSLTTNWDIECRQYERLFQGEPEPGSEETVTWLMDEIDKARGVETTASVKKNMTVSASAVRVAPDQTLMTRLARLSPISSALADSDQQMSVMVMDDKNIYIGALDGKTPVIGAEITVSGEGAATKTMKTDGSGYIDLPMRNYPSDRDGEAKVNIKVSRDGYRSLEANGIYIKKGSIFKVPTAKDDGTPYPVSWTFWGNDMFLSEYELVTSPFNDSEQEIAIKIASSQNYSLSMYFTDSKGENRLNVGSASGKPGTETHAFSGQWLKNAPADGKLYAEITPQGSSTITYQAMIKLIAPKLKKAIGDPNFKLLTTPGIQFTLPESWPKPLGGLTIAINTPLDEIFQVRAYFDMNGNGAITMIEAGKNDLTDAEQTLLRSYAGNVYESLWQGFQERVNNAGYEATEEQITGWLSEQGYTLDVVYQEALVNVRYSRIFDLYCPDAAVTDEDIEAYLQSAFVEPDREAYENDIPRYEREILNAGNESFFTPAGYRIIRQILLPYPQSVVNEINALQPALEDGAALLDELYKAVADAAIAGDDIDAAREAYKKQAEAYAELLGRVVELEESALPMMKEKTDEIARRYAAGESFESLIAEYGKEAGADAGQELLFHPDSEAWAEAFRQQVSALENPGDITEPFVTNLGIHIVLYQGDLPSGVHELTQEERDALRASALQNKQMEALQSFLDTWRTQYQIETHPEML